MKKIKIPNKLRATISKLDVIVSVGIALACIGTLIVSSVQFKNGLTDINSNMTAAHALPYNPYYIREQDMQTYSNEEVEAAWEKKCLKDKAIWEKSRKKTKTSWEETQVPMTIAQKFVELDLQPHDPGLLADLTVVGTCTGHSEYRYGSFIADVKIDKVLSSSTDTSKLRVGGLTENTYKIPPLDLHKGDIIKIYNEIALRTTHHGEKEFATCKSNTNFYTWHFPPFRPNRQYLFFLNYAPKTDIAKTSPAKFRVAPSFYGRIPISNAKTFEPNIFCANLPTKDTTERDAVKPLGAPSEPEALNEDFDRQWQEAYDKIPKFTYHDANKIDLFVDSSRTEQFYRDKAAKILQKYL